MHLQALNVMLTSACTLCGTRFVQLFLLLKELHQEMSLYSDATMSAYNGEHSTRFTYLYMHRRHTSEQGCRKMELEMDNMRDCNL